MSDLGIFDSLTDFAFAAGPERALRLFWHFFLVDLPRYFVTDILLVAHVLYRRFCVRQPVPAAEAFEASAHPLVSVVVPVLNEAETILRTVESLQLQTYPAVEIVLVDDGSEDATPGLCRELAHRFPNVRQFRFEEREGKSAALNLGAHFSRGAILCFVDSDTTFDRDAIERIVGYLADPTVGCVSGNVRVRNTRHNLLTELQNLEYGISISVGRRVRAGANLLPIVSGAFGAFRRDAFFAIGGHDPGPGNDSDLTAKMRKQGYRVAFAADAVCMTNVPTRIAALFRQRRRWARNLVKNRIFKHGNVFRPDYSSWRTINALSSLDSVLFHVVLGFTSMVYLADLALHFPAALPYILGVNYLLYFCAEIFETGIVIGFSERRTVDAWSLLYLPLFNPYKRLLKLARIYGYLEELLFRRSYADPFAPAKVRRMMARW